MFRRHYHRKHGGRPETLPTVGSQPTKPQTDKTQGVRPTEGYVKWRSCHNFINANAHIARRSDTHRDETEAVRYSSVVKDSTMAVAERAAYISSITSQREIVTGVSKQVNYEPVSTPQAKANEESYLSHTVTTTVSTVYDTFVEEKTPGSLPSVAASQLETSLREEVSPSKPTTFALIVGIDTYLKTARNGKAGIRELQGCVNDARDFAEYLKTALNVPPRNILTLFNESATRDNIIAAFNSHLVHNGQIAKGDLIFFFYAGHGDSVAAPGWNEDGRKVETICPYDVTVFEGNSAATDEASSVTYGIPDRTFNALMRQLANTKGDNIVAIFDCCHSGGIARDSSGMGRELSDSGNLKERPPLPPDLDRGLFRGVLDQDVGSVSRNVHQKIPHGFAYSGAKSHVLLAACQDTQKARELEVSGKHHGRFTYYLLQCLRNDVTNREQPLTYVALVDMVSQRMDPKSSTLAGAGSQGATADGANTQQPHCEGSHRHRLLFSTEEEARSDSFPLAYQFTRLNDPQSPEELYVEAGLAQGVSPATRFVYRYRDTTSSGELYTYGTLLPKAVEANRASLKSMDGQPWASQLLSKQMLEDRLHGSERVMVTISTWGYKPMKVWYEYGVALPVSAPGNSNAGRFTKAESSSEADICCKRGIGGYTLERRDPLIAHFEDAKPVVHLPSGFSVTEDASIFNDIAHFNFHLYNHNSSARVREDLAFDVRLHPLQRHDDGGLQARYRVKDGSQDLLAYSALCHPKDSSTYSVGKDGVKEALITDVTEFYGITVVNKSPASIKMFVYAFYFDPETYEISNWYHPLNEKAVPLPVNGSLAIGYGKDSDNVLQFSLAEGSKRETGFLKIYISTVYMDMSNIIQASPFGHPPAADRAAHSKKVEVIAGWSSAVYALTVTK